MSLFFVLLRMKNPGSPINTSPFENHFGTGKSAGKNLETSFKEQNIYCHISFISQPIAVKFCTLLLLIQPNKPYDTTPRLDPSI